MNWKRKLMLKFLKIAMIIVSVQGFAKPCDQKTYDSIYKSIILETMATKITHDEMEKRNRAIETLRKLCKGQLSTFERPNLVDEKRN